jgi:hypothetical protein
VKSKIIYRCSYEFTIFNDGIRRVESEKGIEAFTHGFWINHFYELTQSDRDAKYWIPPSAIKYISKGTVAI